MRYEVLDRHAEPYPRGRYRLTMVCEFPSSGHKVEVRIERDPRDFQSAATLRDLGTDRVLVSESPSLWFPTTPTRLTDPTQIDLTLAPIADRLLERAVKILVTRPH